MYALTVLVPAAAVDAVVDWLADAPASLATATEDADAGTSAEQPVFDEPGMPGGAPWRQAQVQTLFAGEAQATAAAAGLAARFGERQVSIESIAPVDDRDWVRATQAQFGPTEVEPGFWIVPSWSEVPPQARQTMRLDPGMAFGTGTHPTTRMCLRWVARMASRRPAPWQRVLDYGCGSGVLAIAAALFRARHVDAVDIDPAAVEATRANAAANGVALNVALNLGMGVGDGGLADGLYDLVLANILATPLTQLAPLLAGRLGSGAELVLSGILERQADSVCEAYAPWLPLGVADRDDGWVLLAGANEPAGSAATPRSAEVREG